MTYDSSKHHRRSVRLAGHDYASAGWYFLTICAAKRGDIFGRVVDDKVQLNRFGKVVEECWRALPEHFPYVVLDEFIVMPDHFHGIVVFTHDATHDVNAPVGAQHAAPLRNVLPQSLSAVTRSFKAAVTSRINQLRAQPTQVWQRSYWEHIIRDERDLTNTRRYIIENPQRWTTRNLNER